MRSIPSKIQNLAVHQDFAVLPKTFRTYLPYLTLLLWVMPIVLLRYPQQSLMAHDEGIYATQARAILQTGNWLAPQWGGAYSFDRTIGIQWLIAVCYLLFGVNEGSARLPSAIALLISTILVYQIGTRLLNARIAWIAAAVFSVIPLVVQYGRLATQDAALMGVEVVAIWALLNAETIAPWGLLAGSMFGIGFMIKGFMIIPAAIALLPYLWQRKQHWKNRWLYVGFGLGLLIPIAWLTLSTMKYGSDPINQLFGKLFHLKGQTYQGAGTFYYFWNIPANGFPWVFFALGGLWLVITHAAIRSFVKAKSLLIGFPIILFIELTIFGTKTHYYPIQLMPFVGWFAAIALHHLARLYLEQKRTRWFIGLNLVMGAISLLLLTIFQRRALIAETFSLDLSNIEINQAAIVILVVGLGWLSLPVIWLLRDRVGLFASAQHWIAAWLMTSWLAVSMLHFTGLWGNYTPELKSFLERSSIREVLNTQTVGFLVEEDKLTRGGRKTQLLLHFYTPRIGQLSRNPKQLPDNQFAWIDPNLAKQVGSNYRVIDSFEDWILGKRSQSPKSTTK